MKINGERLKQAREIRGLTQDGLAFRVGSSQPHISLIEQNAESPSSTLVEALALATGFSTAFFVRPSGPDLALGSLSFRKRRKMPSLDFGEIHQTARAAVELIVHLSRRYKPIPVTLPRANCNPSEAAQYLRAEFGISPDAPVTGLIRKLEKLGVIVIYLPMQVEGFDGFSAWSDEETRRPIVVLSWSRHGDRIRRTVAHECGHLVIYQDFLGSISERESEANDFASELLFPTAPMKQEAIPPLTLVRLAELKRRWGVSIQEISHAAHRRGIITARQKGYIRAKLAKRNWLSSEPVEIPVEYPRLLTQMIDSGFPNEKTAVRSLAQETGYPQSLIAAIISANRPRKSEPLAEAGPMNGGSLLRFPETKGAASL